MICVFTKEGCFGSSHHPAGLLWGCIIKGKRMSWTAGVSFYLVLVLLGEF